MSTNRYSGESAYTGDIASSYEDDRNVEEHWRQEQRYVEKVVATMPEGSHVLDIPVGTGRFFEYYQANDVQVVGVDISEAMLEEAAKRVKSPLIQLRRGDATSLEYPDDSFDIVFCWRLLHLLPRELLQQAVCELARVTSGKLYCQVYVRDTWYYPLRIWRIFGRVLSRIRAPQGRKDKPWQHIQSYEYGEASLVQLFSDCGLRIATVDTLGLYGALKVKVIVAEKG